MVERISCPYCLHEKIRLLTDDVGKCLLCEQIFHLNEDEEETFLKLRSKKKFKEEEDSDDSTRNK